DQIISVTDMMRTLNKHASEGLQTFNPRAVTDITGFGLLGHAYEMAKGSGVRFEIDNKHVALLPGTKELANKQVFPAVSRTNHAWLKEYVEYGNDISTEEDLILCDSITSGGLLISLTEEEAKAYINYLSKQYSIEAQKIGKVSEQKEKSIYVK